MIEQRQRNEKWKILKNCRGKKRIVKQKMKRMRNCRRKE